MRVLFVGDAVAPTGFSRCTHCACDELHAAGHEVHVLGLNYHGDPHSYPYPIYPCIQPLDGGHDGFGVYRLPKLAVRLSPDVIVILQDPWNIPAYLDALKSWSRDVGNTPVVGWLAVDGKNQHGADCNGLTHVVTWTDFAARELEAGGYTGPSTVIPLGVDHEFFYPMDKVEARHLIFSHLPESATPPPDNAFLVGVVGRNQVRKRLDLTIEYFAAWVKESGVTDAYLYLHVAPTGDYGVDIRSLVRYYGISRQVIIASPALGLGVDDDHMRATYAAMDVYLTTTQGEGWGLPCLEAMACGVPAVVPQWSALGEWTTTGAWQVKCSNTVVTSPFGSGSGGCYTIGGIVDREEVVNALNTLYPRGRVWEVASKSALRIARKYSWYTTGVKFRETLEGIVNSVSVLSETEEVAEELPEEELAVALSA